MSRRVAIAFHGHCFDGMASSAVFTRFLRHIEPGELNISYKSLEHQSGGSFVPEEALFGDINVVLDFRYTMSDKLTWWFDHHVSGLVGEKERSHFRRDTQGRKFYDPSYGSCCKLIVDVARDQFGVTMRDLDELVRWADIIDSARFRDAKSAVELQEPALQLMTVVEAHGNDRFLGPRIARLADGLALADLARDAKTQKLFLPLLEAHKKTCEVIREGAEFRDGVVFFDLVGTGRHRYNKFIPYWLYPEARYCVAVLASESRVKVSVGSNPWSVVPRSHDIAEICAAYGGGGHPAVGAVSLKPKQAERGRQIAAEIVAQLRS